MKIDNMNGIAGNHQTNLCERERERDWLQSISFHILFTIAVMWLKRDDWLTWVGTYEDPYPFQDSRTGMQPRRFRIRYRSSMPNFSCLGVRLSFYVSYRWSNRPIVQRQLKQRMLCGRWTRASCDRDKSVRHMRNRNVINGMVKPIEKWQM